jgi:ankyrin repeat protein
MVVPVPTQGDTVSITQLLLDSGARAGLNAQDATGKTALMRAVRKLCFSPMRIPYIEAGSEDAHTLEAVSTLIRAGADVNVIDNDESTALMEVYRLPPRELSWPVPLEESTSLAYFRGTAEVLLAAGANENINTRDKDGRTALLLAASVAAVDDCRALIAAGADATERDARGSTVVMEAIWGIVRNVQYSAYRTLGAGAPTVDGPMLLSLLAEAGGSQVINAINADGYSALFVAMDKFWHGFEKCCLVEILQTLISAGSDVNMTCKGSTALMYACSQTPPDDISRIMAGTGVGRSSSRDPHQQVVEALLQHSTAETINFRDAKGYTSLMLARNARIVQSLIGAGADVHVLANNGLNALMLNCFWRSPCPEIMRILIAAGSSFINGCNDDGDSLVMMFIKSTRETYLRSERVLEILRIFAEAGVDMSSRNNQGKSILFVAVETLYHRQDIIHEVIKLLISACDAEVLNMCDNNGKTLFEAMNSHVLTNDMLLYMIRHGLDVTATSLCGETVLMRVLCYRISDAATIETLLQNGASETINHICHEGRCALALAVSHFGSQSPEIVHLLVQYGADLSIPAVSKSALSMAYGNMSMTRLLLDLGADVNARDAKGQTVLLRRLAPGNEAFQMLLDAGARLMVTDNDGNTSVMRLFEYDVDGDITAEIEMIRAEIDRYHR